MPDERTDPLQQSGAQRLLFLQLLRKDHDPHWTRAELQRELPDQDPAVIALALERLHQQGVAQVEGEQIAASPCARHIDALHFICI